MSLPRRLAFRRSSLLALLALLLVMASGLAHTGHRPQAHPGFQPRYAPAPRQYQQVIVNNRIAPQHVAVIQQRQQQGLNAMPYRLQPVAPRGPLHASRPVLQPGVNPARLFINRGTIINNRGTFVNNRGTIGTIGGIGNSARQTVFPTRLVPTPLALGQRHATVRHASRPSWIASNLGSLGRLHARPNNVFFTRYLRFTENNGIILNERVTRITRITQINKGPVVLGVTNLQKMLAVMAPPVKPATGKPVKVVTGPKHVAVKPKAVPGKPVPALVGPLFNLSQQFQAFVAGSSATAGAAGTGGRGGSAVSSAMPIPFLGGQGPAVAELLGPELGGLAQPFVAPANLAFGPTLGFNPVAELAAGLGSFLKPFAALDAGPTAVLLEELADVRQAAQETVDEVFTAQISELLAPPPPQE
jgi:hypothetical protein